MALEAKVKLLEHQANVTDKRGIIVDMMIDLRAVNK